MPEWKSPVFHSPDRSLALLEQEPVQQSVWNVVWPARLAARVPREYRAVPRVAAGSRLSQAGNYFRGSSAFSSVGSATLR